MPRNTLEIWLLLSGSVLSLGMMGYSLWRSRYRESRKLKWLWLAACIGIWGLFYFVYTSTLSDIEQPLSHDRRLPGGSSQNSRSYESEFEKQLLLLVAGQILFNPPERMRVAETKRMEVRISRGIGKQIRDGLRGTGKIELREIEVGPFMTVTLNGGKAFDIKKNMPEDQFVLGNGSTEWSYDVTALEAGEQKLVLAVGVRIKIAQGKDESRFYPVFEKTIHVDVNRYETFKKFVKDNWQWMSTAILIPIIGALIGLFRKQRQKRKEKLDAGIVVQPKDIEISQFRGRKS